MSWLCGVFSSLLQEIFGFSRDSTRNVLAIQERFPSLFQACWGFGRDGKPLLFWRLSFLVTNENKSNKVRVRRVHRAELKRVDLRAWRAMRGILESSCPHLWFVHAWHWCDLSFWQFFIVCFCSNWKLSLENVMLLILYWCFCLWIVMVVLWHWSDDWQRGRVPHSRTACYLLGGMSSGHENGMFFASLFYKTSISE